MSVFTTHGVKTLFFSKALCLCLTSLHWETLLRGCRRLLDRFMIAFVELLNESPWLVVSLMSGWSARRCWCSEQLIPEHAACAVILSPSACVGSAFVRVQPAAVACCRRASLPVALLPDFQPASQPLLQLQLAEQQRPTSRRQTESVE